MANSDSYREAVGEHIRGRLDAAWSNARRRTRSALQDESGVTLLLALVFIVIGALALTALITFAGGALLNTANLNSQRTLEYAADSATDVAIQNVRYQPTYYPSGGSCLTHTSSASPSITVDTRAIAVYCSGKTTSNAAFIVGGSHGSILATRKKAVAATLFKVTPVGTSTFKGYEITDSKKQILATTFIVAENLSSHSATLSKTAMGTSSTDTFTLVPPKERIVTFYTCLADHSPCNAGNAIVMATADFDDSSSAGHDCTSSSSRTCGTSMAITEWIERYANH